MTSAKFLLQNSLIKVQFFDETFLLTYISLEQGLEMLFISFSNINFQFSTRKLTQKSDNSAETLSTAKKEELIDKYKLAKVTSNKNYKKFIAYISKLRS